MVMVMTDEAETVSNRRGDQELRLSRFDRGGGRKIKASRRDLDPETGDPTGALTLFSLDDETGQWLYEVLEELYGE